MTRHVTVIGGSICAAQCALALAQMGAEVSLISRARALGLDKSENGEFLSIATEEYLRIWPLLLQTAAHPRVRLYIDSEVEAVSRERGHFALAVKKLPRYVSEILCTSCGLCQEACPVKVPFTISHRKDLHSAIHAPLIGLRSVPAAYTIDKNGVAPCQASCPLGVNVPGFICLLSKGKVNEALTLINEAAPLAGVLGRVCTHPCENSCQRAKVDSPVFIQALHRYAADAAFGSIKYRRVGSIKPKKEKIGIVGSGPSGLAAAWELARRGYTPTVFESHAVIGGMLATGIPRFRLPREVREREVEAIRAMGVDIKTGVIVGRDITLADLREQGYRAFYLAIGAGLNNKLNIPGEDLEGVVDVISMLFALNLKVGTTVGSNVVVIGGGNSAVDSARAVKRRSKGTVRILYRRTAEEMTAIKEHIEEAIQEGVLIEYLTAPVEIIGDGTKVTGIRCRRMKLGDAVDATGRRQPVPIEGSEFIIEADHVIVAIGQRPSTSLLRLKDLKTNEDGTIIVDPLTLQTNIPDIFAGGDCVTGPRTVVEAMAAGLQAAESIDRYLRGYDLREGRGLERPQPAEVNIEARYVSPQKRARMPVLPRAARMGSFEETNLGLPEDAIKPEAGRCLSCALCSGCLECERICQVNAVSHKDVSKSLEIQAGAIVSFTSQQDLCPELSGPGVFVVEAHAGEGLQSELERALAVALEVAKELKLRKKKLPLAGSSTAKRHDDYLGAESTMVGVAKDRGRVGVVLCSCGGSIDSVIDFRTVAGEIQRLSAVSSVWRIAQACTEEGARQIKAMTVEAGLGGLVIAACRCCNLDQICFSCTEQRVRCQQYVYGHLKSNTNMALEFVNIREQCAWVHSDTPVEATNKAVGIISSGVARVQNALPVMEERLINQSVLVIGTGVSSLVASVDLLSLGCPVTVVHMPKSKRTKARSLEVVDEEVNLLREIKKHKTSIMAWPESFELRGGPGDYEAVLRYSSRVANIKAGAVIVDSEAVARVMSQADSAFKTSLFGRILDWDRRQGSQIASDFILRETSIGDVAGIFIMSANWDEPPEKRQVRGRATAAKVLCYLSQGVLRPRVSAVKISHHLCRGCGDCALVCPYIEMKVDDLSTARAHIDPLLCLGCGACIARCPTGAITQPAYDEVNIISTLEVLLGKPEKIGVAT